MSIQVVYAIVKAGGRQEKVSVGDVVVVDKLAGEIGDEEVTPPPTHQTEKRNPRLDIG